MTLIARPVSNVAAVNGSRGRSGDETDLLVHILVVSLIVVLSSGYSEESWWLLSNGIVFILLYVGLLAIALRRRVKAIVEISYLFLGLLVLGAASLLTGFTTLTETELPFVSHTVSRGQIAVGCNSVAIYIVSIILGTRIESKWRARKPKHAQVREQFSRPVMVFTILAGFVTQLFAGAIAFLGTLSGGPKFFHMAAVTFLALHAREYLGPSTLVRITGVVGATVLLVAVTAMSGSKALIALAFVPIGVLAHQQLKSKLALVITSSVGVAFYVLVITPVITVARLEAGSAGGVTLASLLDVSSRLTTAKESVTKYGLEEMWLEDSVNRIFYPKTIGFLAGQVEQDGFRMGEGMEYMVWGFVPRFIWPEKPVVNRGLWFTSYIGLSHTEETATSSTGMTAAGELYWQYGYFAVLAGGFLLGFIKQWCMSTFCAEGITGSLIAWVSFFTITASILGEDAEFGSTIILLFSIPITLAVYRRLIGLGTRA
jgi:hypothetical protein